MSTQALTAAKAQDRERVVSAIVLGFVEDPIALRQVLWQERDMGPKESLEVDA
jgi:hypothetical protein